MDKVIQEPVSILTDEELNHLQNAAIKLDGLRITNVMKLINSHRLLLSANAELSFKNQKLKKALEVAKYYLERDAHLPAEQIIDEAMEELK